MSTRTIYKCDRCGKEQDTNGQMWRVGFLVDNMGYSSNYSLSGMGSLTHVLEWCRACVEEFDQLPRQETKAPAAEQPVPTLEDLLREIIREEIEANR